MEITKEEFLEWRSNHVTKAVFGVLEQRIQDAKDILAATAGEDSVADRYLVGMIRGFSELQEVSYED
jgi:hypothetical protein